MKRLLYLLLLLPFIASAQGPPPLIRNYFTTNPASLLATNVPVLNSNNLYSANSSNSFAGPVKIIGRRQFPWITLGGTTIDGTTNHLTMTLTANTTLSWTGVDGDDVILEVIQDGVGGRTLTINNINPWVSSTNQSTSMPLVNTNANFYSYVHLWKKGSTSFGTVSTSPSPWEVDLASQNITSAQLFQAITDEVGASGKAIRVDASGQTDGQAVTWNAAANTWTNKTVGGLPGGSAPQLQFNNAGSFGGASEVLWTPPFLTLSNSTSPDLMLFRNTSFGTNVFSYKWSIGYPSAEFILHEYSTDLSASNIAFGISGGKGSGLVQAHAYGHMLVDSNLYVSGIQTNTGALVQNGAASFGSSVTHNGPVNNAAATMGNSTIDYLGTPVRVINLSSNITLLSTNETSNTVIRLYTFQAPSATNTLTWNLTGPTVFLDSTNQVNPPYMPTNAGSVLRWELAKISGTNYVGGPYGVDSAILTAIANLVPVNGMNIGFSNGVIALLTGGGGGGGGSGGGSSGSSLTNPTISGPIIIPVAPDSTNLDWNATTTYHMQGFTATGSFTNVFQNAPPAVNSQLIYVINNTTATNITCWLGPAAGGNPITNNVWVNYNVTGTNAVICPPGTTRCEWGYNGNQYFFRTTSQLHLSDDGTVLTSTEVFRGPVGAQASPTYSFTGDTNTGMYRSGAGTITFVSGGNVGLQIAANSIVMPTSTSYGIDIGGGSDVRMTRQSSGVVQWGIDGSAPNNITLKAADGSGSSDKPGGDTKLGGGNPTGTGAPGRVRFQVATNSTSTGSTTLNYGTDVTAGGTLKVDTTTTGNVGGGEDNLISYAVPGAELGVNGDYLEFDVWGSFAANANTKDLKVYFGATVIVDTTALVFNGLDWRAHGKIVRTGAATQTATTELTVGGTLLSALNGTIVKTSAPTETLSAASIFKCTGTDSGGVPVDNSIVQNGMVLRWFGGQ